MPGPAGLFRTPADRLAAAGQVLVVATMLMFETSIYIAQAVINIYKAAIMMTGMQLRAARALLGLDQRRLAELAGVSVPTIQRMEASPGTVRGVVDSLTRVIEALDRAGVELIGDNAQSLAGGRGVRLKEPAPPQS
ncbi:helix-turn-helix protein [Tepidamorphus gemmatus]|uniref:Helix-turn-helix protein n=2 Tax=Tepidamorphus gemmatus TaxID=747076 RepID=A0A4R3M893_9HYPH|nr:helix-turn-helix protein [Tepidamorphus gemmatus]